MKVPLGHRLAGQDRFGLPERGVLPDREDAKQIRLAALERLVAGVFETATRHLGSEHEAAKLFAAISWLPPRPEEKGTSLYEDRDLRLLWAFYARPNGEEKMAFAKRIYREHSVRMGNGEGAVLRALQRQLKRVADLRQRLADCKRRPADPSAIVNARKRNS